MRLPITVCHNDNGQNEQNERENLPIGYTNCNVKKQLFIKRIKLEKNVGCLFDNNNLAYDLEKEVSKWTCCLVMHRQSTDSLIDKLCEYYYFSIATVFIAISFVSQMYPLKNAFYLYFR